MVADTGGAAAFASGAAVLRLAAPRPNDGRSAAAGIDDGGAERGATNATGCAAVAFPGVDAIEGAETAETATGDDAAAVLRASVGAFEGAAGLVGVTGGLGGGGGLTETTGAGAGGGGGGGSNSASSRATAASSAFSSRAMSLSGSAGFRDRN